MYQMMMQMIDLCYCWEDKWSTCHGDHPEFPIHTIIMSTTIMVHVKGNCLLKEEPPVRTVPFSQLQPALVDQEVANPPLRGHRPFHVSWTFVTQGEQVAQTCPKPDPKMVYLFDKKDHFAGLASRVSIPARKATWTHSYNQDGLLEKTVQPEGHHSRRSHPIGPGRRDRPVPICPCRWDPVRRAASLPSAVAVRVVDGLLRLANRLPQQLANEHEDLIAHRVAVGVIDVLEVIDIENEHREGVAVAFEPHELTLQVVV